MRKIVISVAPVAGSSKDVQPKAVAEDVIKSAACGAGMVHLHVREKDGRLTANLEAFQETIRCICAQSDIVIQGSTGGISELTMEERCAPITCEKVEMASLNGGSTNLGEAVYQNPFHEIQYCAQQCYQYGVLPEIEVFEIGMIRNIQMIYEKVPYNKPVLFNIVLGHKGAMPADVPHLAAFCSFIPKDALWGITHYGRGGDYGVIAAAIAMGASLVRIGFEDSDILIGKQKAEYNHQLVKRVADLIRIMGYETASPKDVREMFQLKGRESGKGGSI